MAINQTRNAFFSEMERQMTLDQDIIIVSVDLAGPTFDNIRVRFPDRYIGIGIAEQNAVAVACGLAAAGKKAIVYAANPFPLLRAFDQIRNGVCMMQLPIAIVGVGTGFSTSECGSTHFTVEDIAMASLCAGLEIISISDETMAIAMAKAFASQTKPTYYRFGKWAAEPLSADPIDFNKGYRKIFGVGRTAVVATGCTVKLLRDMEFDADEITLFDWFRLSDSRQIAEELGCYKAIVAIEEQLLRGGVGSILLETLNDMQVKTPLVRMGLDMKTGYPQIYGSREYWLHHYGLGRKDVESVLQQFKVQREA